MYQLSHSINMTVYFISNELHIYSVTFFLLIKSKTLNKSLLKISSHNSSLYSLLNSFCYFFITPTLKNSSGTSIYYYKEKIDIYTFIKIMLPNQMDSQIQINVNWKLGFFTIMPNGNRFWIECP